MAATSLRQRLARRVSDTALRLGSLSVRVDDGPGWQRMNARPHERGAGEIAELYNDAIKAWRKTPQAKTLVDTITSFVIGDGIRISSPVPALDNFVGDFWHHPMNLLDNRLEAMSNELVLAGDVFPTLWRNSVDGMSYVRFPVTKDLVGEIVTAPNDWELELGYQTLDGALPGGKFYRAPAHPQAARSDGVMLHYAVNKLLGAQQGEGDLATVIPWMLRYSTMLEGRIRLHWATAAFLWFVKVPAGKVAQKREDYARPPEFGTVMVHEDGEEWEVKAPNLRASDAANDMTALRRMTYLLPPHWHGEDLGARAVAEAMEMPAERRLRRRQKYFVFLLEDMLFQAYQRAVAVGRMPALETGRYDQLFTAELPDISRRDNTSLSQAAYQLALAYSTMAMETAPQSRTLLELFLQGVFKASGEPQSAATVRKIVDEVFKNAGKVVEQPVIKNGRVNGHVNGVH